MYTQNSLYKPYSGILNLEKLEENLQNEARNSRYLSSYKQASIYGNFLDFDSRIFHKRCALIKGISIPDKTDVETLNGCLSRFIEIIRKDGVQFLSAKIYNDDIAFLHVFERAGFSTMNCHQQYRFDFHSQEIPNFPETCTLRIPAKDEAEKIGLLVREIFKNHCDRFHNDPLLEKADSDNLHEEWGRNSVLGFADEVMVAEINGDPAGFCTAKENRELNQFSPKKFVDFVLLGVHPRYRKKGIHTNLLRNALRRWKSSVDFGEIVTQTNNLATLKTYAKLGIKPSASFFAMHKHF